MNVDSLMTSFFSTGPHLSQKLLVKDYDCLIDTHLDPIKADIELIKQIPAGDSSKKILEEHFAFLVKSEEKF